MIDLYDITVLFALYYLVGLMNQFAHVYDPTNWHILKRCARAFIWPYYWYKEYKRGRK